MHIIWAISFFFCYDNLARPCEPPTAYFCGTCYNKGGSVTNPTGAGQKSIPDQNKFSNFNTVIIRKDSSYKQILSPNNIILS